MKTDVQAEVFVVALSANLATGHTAYCYVFSSFLSSLCFSEVHASRFPTQEGEAFASGESARDNPRRSNAPGKAQQSGTRDTRPQKGVTVVNAGE
jgi:hypothetical protein